MKLNLEFDNFYLMSYKKWKFNILRDERLRGLAFFSKIFELAIFNGLGDIGVRRPNTRVHTSFQSISIIFPVNIDCPSVVCQCIRSIRR